MHCLISLISALSLCSDRAVRSSLPREGRSRGHVYLFIACTARPATWPLPPAREGGGQEEDGVGASVGGAALPTTTRTGRPRERREPAVRCSRGLLQSTRDTDTSAIAGGRFQNGQAHACTRAHSRPIRPVGRGHLRPATRRLSGCTQHIDWHASPSLHRFGDLRELSVPLLSGTGSRFGTGVGEEQTASGAIDRRSPGQPVAVAPCACRLCCVACSKSIACQICAPLGHGPKTATVRWIAAASAPADGLGETGCASPPSAILSHRPSWPRRTSCWARDKIR